MKYLFILFASILLMRGVEPDPTMQTEKDWVDDRWSKTDVGPVLGGTFDTPKRRTNKGIAVNLGGAAICFDTDTLRYSAGWTGGFVQMNAGRYGLMAALKPKGNIQFSSNPGPGAAATANFNDPRKSSNGPLPKEWAHYKGFYAGEHIAFSYTVGEAKVLDCPAFENGIFTRTIEVSPSAHEIFLHLFDGTNEVSLTGNGIIIKSNGAVRLQLPASKTTQLVKVSIGKGNSTKVVSPRDLIRTKSPRWMPLLETDIAIGNNNKALAIDTISVPFDNPWKALMFTSGVDFLPDGRAAVSTAHGDVWLVSGIKETSRKAQWKRFATGLYQPLGLKVVNGKIHVLERDQITILHDQNSDGEADFYENFNNDSISGGGSHSYTTSIETDSEGNFYFVKCAENTPQGGSVVRVPRDGNGVEVIATGFRNPNGMGIGPGNEITVADQQGDWVPETRLDLIKPGGFYGYMPMHKRDTAPKDYDAPWCWIPRKMDNSAGGQAWLPQNGWGALGGKMLHLSYGRCSLLAVLQDQTHPRQNAGIVPLIGGFQSGIMRARINPHDGHLYTTGLRGWQTAALRDGCLQRVRYTGKAFNFPVGFSANKSGISLTFDSSLDLDAAIDLESYSVERWNYKWSSAYGSDDYSVSQPGQKGRDILEIKEARVSADKRTVIMEIKDFRPAMQVLIKYQLISSEGIEIPGEFAFTANVLD